MKKFYCLFLILLPANIFSQIKNIEDVRMDLDSNGLFGGVFWTGKLDQDKLFKIDIKSGANLAYKKDKHLFMGLGSLSYEKSDESVTDETAYVHFRYNYLQRKKIAEEIFYQATLDRTLGVDRRIVYGGGLRFTIDSCLQLGFLVMGEKEKLVIGKTLNTTRMSDYISLRFKFKDKVEIRNVLYYQPSLSIFKDYRVSNESKMILDLSKKISFLLGAALLYDSYPAPEIMNFTCLLSGGINVKF